MRAWWKVALVVVAGVVGSFLLFGEGGGHGHGTVEGEAAPPLRLADLSGRKVDLGDLRGKVVAVNFWATWCAPCKEELPALAAAWSAGRGCLEILGVAEDSPRDDVAAAVQRHAIPFPVLVDPDGEVAHAYRVQGLPSTVLVDAEGKVRKVFLGPVSRETLEGAASRLFPARCGTRG